MIHRRLLGPATALALAACTVAPAAAPAAARTGTFAGTLGIKVPKGASASVRAIDGASGAVARSATVGRTGRFDLTLPGGRYLVVGTVVSAGGKVSQKRIGLTLRPGQKRRGAKLTARRKKRRVTGHAAYVQELGNVTPGAIAVGVHRFTGTTGDLELDTLAGGLADLVIVDVLQGVEKCGAGGVVLVEIIRRADVEKELAFQQSPYVDPSTRVTRNFILEDVEVQGSVRTGAGGKPEIAVQTIDKATGRRLQSYTEPVGADPFAAEERISGRLTADLCRLSNTYEVTLDVSGEGRFATHSGSGAIHQVVRATRAVPATHVWTASGPLQWGNLGFVSKTPPCVMIDPIAPLVAWHVRLEDVGAGALKVEWGVDGNDGATASLDCPPDGAGDPDPPPQPGLPGPGLYTTGPGAFTLPYAGGTQALSGTVQDGGDGFFDSGSLKVTPGGIG